MDSLNDVKNVLILGFGREGKSSYRYLKAHYPSLEIGIADKRDMRRDEMLKGDAVKVFYGDDYLREIEGYELVLKSPGISLEDDFVAASKAIISSQVDLFLQGYHGNAIGVTGTKGKSTTATLIYHLLKLCGKKVLLAGNIGVPVFDVAAEIDDETIVVLELSCHQLQHIHRSPHVAILLNLFPEHLDYYKDFAAYKKAKSNIFRFQQKDDFVIVPEQENMCVSGPGILIPYCISRERDDVLVQYKLSGKEMQLCFDRNGIKLPGEHNLSNVGAACIAALFCTSLRPGELTLPLSLFPGLKHRLEFVGEYKQVKFYNDSISTIPETTVAALRCFQNRVDTLILGGFNRGVSYRKLVEEIKVSQIETVIFMPETGKIIFAELLAAGFCDLDGWIVYDGRKVRSLFADDMKQIVADVFKYTAKGGVCLLSPAAASYNLFKNFEDRGEVFIKAVKQGSVP